MEPAAQATRPMEARMKNAGDANYGLDPADGAQICVTEKYKDWYRDPWSWPELGWIIAQPSDFPMGDVVVRSGADFTLKEQVRFEPILVPKSTLGGGGTAE